MSTSDCSLFLILRRGNEYQSARASSYKTRGQIPFLLALQSIKPIQKFEKKKSFAFFPLAHSPTYPSLCYALGDGFLWDLLAQAGKKAKCDWQCAKKYKYTEGTNNVVLQCEWFQYGGLFGFHKQDTIRMEWSQYKQKSKCHLLFSPFVLLFSNKYHASALTNGNFKLWEIFVYMKRTMCVACLV